MVRFRLEEAEFLQFRDQFRKKSGIWFEESRRFFVERRVGDRVDATGMASYADYWKLLQRDAGGQEWQAITNLLTVNETYFFREAYQFEALVGPILSEVSARVGRTRPIRIWCLPSSTGEEPYTVALFLLHHWPDLERFDVHLLASDIDTDVLEAARRGVYGERSIQHVPEPMLRRHFSRVGSDYQISEALRQSVEFTRVNLTDPISMGRHRDFDVIFCRNLLIYFDDAGRRQAAGALFEALVPGGFLCLGHSESMSRMSSLFRLREFPEAAVYQRPPERP